MYEFYADGVTMRENNNPLPLGPAADVSRRRQLVASAKRFLSLDVQSVQSSLRVEMSDGHAVDADQVAGQSWRDGRIITEEFDQYDTSARVVDALA